MDESIIEKKVGKLKYHKKDIISRSRGIIVYKGKYEKTIDVAIKRIQREDAKIEIDVLKNHHFHPNLVKYYTTERDDDFNYIATELCQGTLEDLVHGNYKGEGIGTREEILKQITDGLNYLHDGNVVHRDIKPQNILISYRHDSVPPLMKLTDFGISRKLKSDQTDLTKTGLSGTMGWIAPEFYDQSCERYTKQADIFPLGCIFCYVLSDGIHPFGEEKELRQGYIKKGEYQLPDKVRQFDYAVELITAMLDSNPKKRPTVRAILDHMFFNRVRSPTTRRFQKNQVDNQVISKSFSQKKDEDMLGRGSFNTIVYKVIWDEFGNQRAIKKIAKEFNDSHINERMILSDDNVAHPNVIRYYGYEEDDNHVYICMELCHSTLVRWVENDNFEMSNHDLEQIAQGLSHLHRIGIVHRDIKPSNILVADRSGETIFKLADFGISKKLDNGEKDVTMRRRGSTGWMAPELFAIPAEYTKAVDIFAIGLVSFYTKTKGSHPFSTNNKQLGDHLDYDSCQEKIKNKIAATNMQTIQSDYNLCDLIERIIKFDVDDRLTITQVLDHPYFWTTKKSLEFVRDVSDSMEQKDWKNQPKHRVIEELEKLKEKILGRHGNDWTSTLTPSVLNNLNEKRKGFPYDGNSVEHLLRVIRNKYGHYSALSDDEKNEFGSKQNGYWNYWSSKFPNLVTLTWDIWNKFYINENLDDSLTVESQESTVTAMETDDSTFNSSRNSTEPIETTRDIEVDGVLQQLSGLTLEQSIDRDIKTSHLPFPYRLADCAWNPVYSNLLICTSYDATMYLYDTSTDIPKQIIFPSDIPRKTLFSVAWKRNGEVLATGNIVGDIFFWKFDGTQLHLLPNITKKCFTSSIEFHPTEEYLLGTSPKKVVVWTDPLRSDQFSLYTDFETVTSATFNPLQPLVAVCGSFKNPTKALDNTIVDFTIVVLEITGDDSLVPKYLIRKAHEEKIHQIKWQLDGGRHLASCSDDNSVKVWLEGEQIQNLNDHQSAVLAIEWMPKSIHHLASATANGTVSIWNVSTGSRVQRFDRVHRQIIRTLSFSDDGKFLASGGFDNHINLWEMKNEKLEFRKSFDTGYRINKLFWNCDGSNLIAVLSNTTSASGPFLFLLETKTTKLK